MTETAPNCDKCGTVYYTPAHYRRNMGLCEECRPIKLCPKCGGEGCDMRKNEKGCGWSRHEETVKLACLGCGEEDFYPLTSNEANGVFNVFCPNGRCEDLYAARL